MKRHTKWMHQNKIFNNNKKNKYKNNKNSHCTKNEVFINDFLSKCDSRIWSDLLKTSFIENFISLCSG